MPITIVNESLEKLLTEVGRRQAVLIRKTTLAESICHVFVTAQSMDDVQRFARQIRPELDSTTPAKAGATPRPPRAQSPV